MKLLCGDCLEILPTLDENSIDACVTDPPYHLTSIVNRFGKSNLERDPETLASPIGRQSQNPYGRVSRGFMGKQWDGGDIAFRPETWAAVYRVLKPGAHLVAFGGTRTYHRMACAIEDAGFEIRDQIQWLYGSGFPKSHDVSKGIDRAAGITRATDYKPNNGNAVYGHGMGGGEWNAASDPPATTAARQWQGWGTALKPANEPIVLARKPLSEKTVASNVLKWGTGAINVDGCRVGNDVRFSAPAKAQPNTFNCSPGSGIDYLGKEVSGRWPANVIHDGSEEVVDLFPETGKSPPIGSMGGGSSKHSIYGDFAGERNENGYGDEGSAARFFYCAKASKKDRNGSKHPTVKPLKLMRYLCRLITPPGGTILDPFAGSGTTGQAARDEGFRAVLIEREQEYQNDIRRRSTA